MTLFATNMGLQKSDCRLPSSLKRVCLRDFCMVSGNHVNNHFLSTGCTYENSTYANQATFRSRSRPCDQCRCDSGTVTCRTQNCPSLSDCRDLITLEGACCPICLSCDERRNGERWYGQNTCQVCQCLVSVASAREA